MLLMIASVPSPASQRNLEAIWRAIRAIPRGQIATYGLIAERAGLPRRARLVGHALKVAPPTLKLPWHRVVAAGGRIAFPKSSRSYIKQSQLLRAEGLSIHRGRVKIVKVPDLDELLWKSR